MRCFYESSDYESFIRNVFSLECDSDTFGAIAGYDNDVTLIDVTQKHEVDLTGYDRIGFASGIYFGKFAEQLHNFAKVNLPTGKNVFFIATAGNTINHNFNSIVTATKEKHCNEIGRYQCGGFDTFGPFKLVGGLFGIT